MRTFLQTAVAAGHGQEQSQLYYRASNLISELKNAMPDSSDARKKIVMLREHFAVLTGQDGNNDHGLDQHHVWAISCLGSIERELES